MHLNASSASGTPSGWSVGELGSLFNSRFNLTGLVTPGAAVVGVSYENLLLSARPPSFGSEACMAFSTGSRYAGVLWGVTTLCAVVPPRGLYGVWCPHVLW